MQRWRWQAMPSCASGKHNSARRPVILVSASPPFPKAPASDLRWRWGQSASGVPGTKARAWSCTRMGARRCSAAPRAPGRATSPVSPKSRLVCLALHSRISKSWKVTHRRCRSVPAPSTRAQWRSAARKIMAKARKIAAYKLQRRPRDLVYENGVFHVTAHAGPQASIAHFGKKFAQKVIRMVFKRRSGLDLPVIQRDAEAVTFAAVASAAHLGYDLPLGMVPGLEESHFFDPADMLFDYGTQVVVVEVDPETGHIALLRHVMVDDCGRVINPLLVEGQEHGGAAQGIGQALMEAVVHGSGGEPLVRGFSEYAMPHASDLPPFETDRTDIATKLNPLGVRGVGEGATIGATPAVVNAVLDALAPLGVTEVPIPMTPMRVWRAVERARHGVVAMTTETSHHDLSPVGKPMHAN